MLGAYSGVAALLALAPQNLPRLESVSVDLPVLLFALLLSTAVAVGLGVFTAVRATSGNVRAGLGEGGREQAGSQSSQRAGRIIVAAQIAITLVLVAGAGLLGRSLMKVLDVDPGFRVRQDCHHGRFTSLGGLERSEIKDIAGHFLLESDRSGSSSSPGYERSAQPAAFRWTAVCPMALFLLMTQMRFPKTSVTWTLWLANSIFCFNQKPLGNADFGVVTDGYFEILGIPLLRGRFFNESDGPDSPHVAVISESLARERWPGQDPIGHTIEFGNMDGDLRLLTIVGIVGDVHEYGLDAPPRPTVYVDLFQRPHPAITITMLTDADTQMVTSAARGILHDLNPEIPPNFRTFSQVYSASLGSRRFNLILIAFFGMVALLLAVAGVFGVMAYSVSRRTREIGIRVAVGASYHDVVAMIVARDCARFSSASRLGLSARWHSPAPTVTAVRRDRNRSANLCGGGPAAGRSCAAGLLHPRAQGDEGRSGGGAAQ